MPDEHDPRKLPVVVDSPVETDFFELPKLRPEIRYWRPVLIACALSAAAYLIYLRPSTNGYKPTPLLENPGWDELSACSDSRSLDGSKELDLLSDGKATLHEKTAIKDDQTIQDHVTEGVWRFDKTSNRYSITFKGETINYLIVSSEGTRICMLVEGEISAADLPGSWFAFPSDDDPGDDREPDTPGL